MDIQLKADSLITEALIVKEDSSKQLIATVSETSLNLLYTEGDTIVKVLWSSLNYKDAMAICGNRGRILKKFPIVPGIDFAGEVIETNHPSLKKGEKVLATGYGIGERFSGGYSKLVRINGSLLVPLPETMSCLQAMQFGTAGFTAMLAVNEINNHFPTAKYNTIAVTGAGGGLGGIAISILKAFGFNVVAITSKTDKVEYFNMLGANTIVSLQQFIGEHPPLETGVWNGVIDTLGGKVLARMLSQTKTAGVVVACGLAISPKLHTTVLPFILRGIRLIGIDSVYCNITKRIETWTTLAKLLKKIDLNSICNEINLHELLEVSEESLENQGLGRLVIKIQD